MQKMPIDYHFRPAALHWDSRPLSKRLWFPRSSNADELSSLKGYALSQRLVFVKNDT